MENNNPKRTYTLVSKELPLLSLPASSYGLETVLNGETYYSRPRLDKSSRPHTELTLAS